MSELAPEIPADEAPDPAVLAAEWRLRLLEEMAEIGMARLRALPPVGDSDGKTRDGADPFDRLSRAIRLTLVLHAKTHEQLRDLKAGVFETRAKEKAAADKRASERVEKIREDRIERVRELVANVVDSEHENDDDFVRISDALDIRLEEDEPIFGNPEHPLRAVVERLCKDLDVHPDWSLWEGDGWIVDDPLTRRRFVSLKPASDAEATPPEPETPEAGVFQPNGHVLE
jgi:hypothetical protein